ncbi:unnamed protein product [Caenorhabditis auriculariae]|uniref:Tubby C-terminal domain-containing protein n=1 Tax=Caenorhabditis auriculariae TaxID=2777116 RepID=A0A8S1GS26_9PELO|nr:unnamed protein product [Caenorhabditis auriculariae]
MKILWESEDWPGAQIEPSITHLSWIPQPEKPGHGLLGVGSDSGSVGITLTDFLPTPDDNARYNFNLRGHHTGIRMVTWNKTQCKLASCDASGIIYVWVRNEDRWSVELVNDRGVKVNDLSWSPCGSSALICYEDNFVLIGSASGQRIWSNSFPTGVSTTVTCGVWAPDSKQLVLGFASGNIQVLSNQGANITEKKFTDDRVQNMAFSSLRNEEWTLALLTSANRVMMINAYDQIEAQTYKSPYAILQMQWNCNGTLLGLINSNNELVMLNESAKVVHRETITIARGKALTAFTWAHNGQAVIVAAGGRLTIGKILPGVPSLFDIVAYDLWKLVGHSSQRADKLPLPAREMSAVKALDHHIIRCRIPRTSNLCSFVCSVIDARCYCTIRPMSKGSNSYVLCIEHLGGLVPVLIGRQVNRFLPQFQIFLHPSSPFQPAIGSNAQVEDVNALVRNSTGRNSLWRRSKRQIRALMSRHVRSNRSEMRLVQVSSNVWCTRFNISSLSPSYLPYFLGQVVYKTSVLHLQPRQMTIDLAMLGLDKNSANDGTTAKEQGTDENSQQASNTADEGLTSEERLFFEKVLTECLSLRAAMDATSINLSASQGTSQVSAVKEISARTNQAPERTVTSSSRTESHIDVTSMASSASTWHEEIENLEFIDGDDDGHLIPATSSTVRKISFNPQAAGSMSPSRKETEEIKAHVDKLASIASQLSRKHADFNSKKDRASISKMRSQMKELLRRVNEIEKKVCTGDVKVETLGEGTFNSPRLSSRIITMHNKTPFWNEHNQVYQLDFGGRVTQESAKNFQVEMDGKQVLQFGRIEGGAYTLDFRKPFSASQAFAVALASITQRLNYTIHYILSSSRRNWMDYAQKDDAKDRKTMLSTLSTTRLDF